MMPVGDGPILIARPLVRRAVDGDFEVVTEWAYGRSVEPYSTHEYAMRFATYLARQYPTLAPEPGCRWERVPDVDPPMLRSVPLEAAITATGYPPALDVLLGEPSNAMLYHAQHPRMTRST